MLKMIAVAFMAALSVFAHAQTSVVRGYVRDAGTQSPLSGATVVVSGSNRFAATDENGYFEINGLTQVSEAEVRFLGYKTQVVTLSPGQAPHVVQMTEDVVLTDEVIVYSTRATEKSGVTFTNVSKQALQKQNFGLDLPLVLNWTPSLVTTSDAGGGVGYTGVRIRGSDATRINVTMNGIPYNDSESHQTYWVNVPDIASSTQSIQIQRGVGTSANGSGAFGASINLQTNVKNDKAYADVIHSFGSFNTNRSTIGFGSGLINDRFVFDGRFSLITSDGYIDRASSNLKSYYVSGGYYGNKTMVKAIVFGGQEITYQSWNGVPESRLRGDEDAMEITVAAEGWNAQQRENLLTSGNRTFNMFTYKNQVDNYRQDHYQLHLSHRFDPTLTANASLHWTYGRGYYEEYRYDEKFSRYGLGPADVGGTPVNSSDFIRRRWLDNDFYGVTFSVNKETDDWQAVLGGAINRYDGDHFGRILWTSVAAGIPIDYQYYFSNAVKDDFNIYLKNTYQLTESISGFVDLQYRGIWYTTAGRHNRQFDFDIDKQFGFFNPKLGLTWSYSPSQSLYVSYSVANREPVRDDFVDAFGGKEPRAERLDDIEAGWRLRKNSLLLAANAYLMTYDNQLVLTGAVNDVGASLRTNVDGSYRAGIELEAQGRLSPKFALGANLTLSRNKIRDFTEVLYDYGANYDEYNVVENKYSNTDISFSPNVIGGSILSYNIVSGLELSLLTKYVGKQYLDNTSNNDRKLDPYVTNDVRLVYTMRPRYMREISVSLLANNILDEKYESNGYTYGYLAGPESIRQNYYFPQAGFNVMAMVALRF